MIFGRKRLAPLMIAPGPKFSVAEPPVNGPTDLFVGMVELVGGKMSGPPDAGGAPPPPLEREIPGGGPEAGAVSLGLP
jgi:hypothetical protein